MRILIISLIVLSSCSQKLQQDLSDCVKSANEAYHLCTVVEGKEVTVKVVNDADKKVAYIKELSNGGNAEWVSEDVIKVNVFTGYNDDMSTYYYSVSKQQIVQLSEVD